MHVKGQSSVVVQLLTNVSIYWYNAAITSSMRLYYETMGPFAKPNNRFEGYVRVRPSKPYSLTPAPDKRSTGYVRGRPLLVPVAFACCVLWAPVTLSRSGSSMPLRRVDALCIPSCWCSAWLLACVLCIL